MQIEEFEKQDRGPYLFDRFRHRDTVDSRLGSFSIELIVNMDKAPNQDMANAMRILIDRFEKNEEEIAQMVFREYRAIAESQPDWLEDCEVPLTLSIDGLEPFLTARVLSVSDDVDDVDDQYRPRVYMSPQWDEEHGFYLKFDSDKMERVDC